MTSTEKGKGNLHVEHFGEPQLELSNTKDDFIVLDGNTKQAKAYFIWSVMNHVNIEAGACWPKVALQ